MNTFCLHIVKYKKDKFVILTHPRQPLYLYTQDPSGCLSKNTIALQTK